MAVTGVFKNYNTIEEFKAADKTVLFNQVADEVGRAQCRLNCLRCLSFYHSQIWKSVTIDRSTTELSRFLLITFADLKKYKYYYWFAFPAFVAKPSWEISNDWIPAHDEFSTDSVCASYTAIPFSALQSLFTLVIVTMSVVFDTLTSSRVSLRLLPHTCLRR